MTNNNGMMTKIWGPPGWLFLHCVTMGYPTELDLYNNDHIIRASETKKFFESLGNVLPCKYCRQSYNEYIQELPIDDHLFTRKDLAKWFYDIHNKVNDKLDVDKEEIPSFQEFYDRYEMYRSKCNKTNKKEKGCVKSKDGIKKQSFIQIVDEDGNDYCINTQNLDNSIITDFFEKDDTTKLHLLSSNSKHKLKHQAIECIEYKTGDVHKARCILKYI